MYRELFGFRSRGEPGTRWAEVALVGGRSRVYIWKRGCRCAGVIARIEPPGALSSHNKSAGHSPGSALPPSSFHGPWPVLVIIAQRAHVARRFVHPAMLHTRDPTESRLDSSRHLFPPPSFGRPEPWRQDWSLVAPPICTGVRWHIVVTEAGQEVWQTRGAESRSAQRLRGFPSLCFMFRIAARCPDAHPSTTTTFQSSTPFWLPLVDTPGEFYIIWCSAIQKRVGLDEACPRNPPKR